MTGQPAMDVVKVMQGSMLPKVPCSFFFFFLAGTLCVGYVYFPKVIILISYIWSYLGEMDLILFNYLIKQTETQKWKG